MGEPVAESLHFSWKGPVEKTYKNFGGTVCKSSSCMGVLFKVLYVYKGEKLVEIRGGGQEKKHPVVLYIISRK